jgi:GDPmannose 4,6-dehydratase
LVREFCEVAFSHVGLDYRDCVRVDPVLLRPADVETLVADASNARQKLGWRNTVRWADLVVEIVDSDLESIKRGSSARAQVGAATWVAV